MNRLLKEVAAVAKSKKNTVSALMGMSGKVHRWALGCSDFDFFSHFEV